MSHDGELPLGEPFAVEIQRRAATVIATVLGELDLATASELEAAVTEVPSGGRCLLDLRRLSFIDSGGVRSIMRLDLRAHAEGWAFTIVQGNGPVTSVLALCRVGDRVEILDDLPEIS
jgi:anti-anti-sigma factor